MASPIAEALNSSFIVPIGAFAVAIVAIAGGIISKVQIERIRAQQRLTLLAQGVPAAEVERMLAPEEQVAQSRAYSRERSMRNTRRTTTVLISIGLGIMAFFAVLAIVLQQREIWAGVATGLIPLAIGLGFLADYRMQVREMMREADMALRD